MWKNTSYSYGSVAKFFHWVVALLILGMLVVGFIMTGMENTPDKFKLYGLHKSTGIAVLTLALIRLMWRAANVAPLLPASLHRLEQLLAHAGHGALYFLMIAMPLSGWLMSSASGRPVSVFGWFVLPDLIQPDKTNKEFFVQAHYVMAWALVAMVSLHVLAALLHHFYYKNNVLVKMLPFTKEG